MTRQLSSEQRPTVRRPAAAPLVLGTLGLTAALFAAAATYLPWLALTTGLTDPDSALLIAVFGPVLVALAIVGLGLSIAAVITAAISRSGTGGGLSIAGLMVSICYGLALRPTQMDWVLLGLWFGI